MLTQTKRSLTQTLLHQITELVILCI